MKNLRPSIALHNKSNKLNAALDLQLNEEISKMLRSQFNGRLFRDVYVYIYISISVRFGLLNNL